MGSERYSMAKNIRFSAKLKEKLKISPEEEENLTYFIKAKKKQKS